MADIIDPSAHADLIALQTAVLDAFDAVEGHAADVGKSGVAWTAEEHASSEELREAARQAVTEKEAALRASGLIEQHGYYKAAQALKTAAKAAREPEAPSEPASEAAGV